MGSDFGQLSDDQLRRKAKVGTVVLAVCWGLVVLGIIIGFVMGKSLFAVMGFNVGLIALMVASFAIAIGIKKAKAELVRRQA